jgi:hypothetical protein
MIFLFDLLAISTKTNFPKAIFFFYLPNFRSKATVLLIEFQSGSLKYDITTEASLNFEYISKTKIVLDHKPLCCNLKRTFLANFDVYFFKLYQVFYSGGVSMFVFSLIVKLSKMFLGLSKLNLPIYTLLW